MRNARIEALNLGQLRLLGVGAISCGTSCGGPGFTLPPNASRSQSYFAQINPKLFWISLPCSGMAATCSIISTLLYFFSNAVQFNTTVNDREALWFNAIGMRNRSPFPVTSQKIDAERVGNSRLGGLA